MSYIIGAIFAIIFESPILLLKNYLLEFLNLIPSKDSEKQTHTLIHKNNNLNKGNKELAEKSIL
jgi:hypothetical protein